MFKITGILVKDKIRRIKKSVENHKLLTLFACVGLFSCVCTTSVTDILYIKNYMKYVIWFSMIYLGVKIINPTQEAMIDYQLIELKLVNRRQFKYIIAAKLYGVGVIVAIINYCIIKEKIIYIVLLLNCVVNIYVFLRSSYKSNILNLIMVVYMCICIYLKSIFLAGSVFFLFTIIFIKLKTIHYEVLLPMYRVLYRLNLRYTGQTFTDTENDEILTEVENLFGGEKKGSVTWCKNFFEYNYKFYWMKEVSRIAYDKEGYILRIMIAVLICISIFYLPEWYRGIAALLNVFIAYDFCLSMYREDIKLFPYGFIDNYNFETILKTKLPIYSIACMIMMLPMIFVLKKYSWCILGIAIIVPLVGITKSFYFLLLHKK